MSKSKKQKNNGLFRKLSDCYSRHKKVIDWICLLGVFLIAAFLITESSPLGLFKKEDPGTDSSVFKYIATDMDRGKMPYKDNFDHKGPLLFIINWLGNRIDSWCGVWFFELASVFFAIVFAYLISRMFIRKIGWSLLAVLFAVTPLLIWYNQESNYVQIYALPMIVAAIYVYLKYMRMKTLKMRDLLAFGVCVGGISLLQINMAFPLAILYTSMVIDVIKNKRAIGFARLTGYIAAGFAVVVLPILLWLVAGGAFGAFVDDYFIYNSKYASDGSMSQTINAMMFFSNNPLTVMSLVLLVYYAFKKKDNLNISMLLLFLVSLYSASMSGRNYYHYAISFIPAVIYPYVGFASDLKEFSSKSANATLVVFVIGVGIWCALPYWAVAAKQAVSAYEHRNEDGRNLAIVELANVIKDNTSENDKISVYRNWNEVYLLSNRESASKYSYQSAADLDHQVYYDYKNDLVENNAKMIAVMLKHFHFGNFGNYWYDADFAEFLGERYEEVWRGYDNSGSEYAVYKLKAEYWAN